MTPDGRVVAIEVKAGATVRAEDLAGLHHIAQRLMAGLSGRRSTSAARTVRRCPARNLVRWPVTISSPGSSGQTCSAWLSMPGWAGGGWTLAPGWRSPPSLSRKAATPGGK